MRFYEEFGSQQSALGDAGTLGWELPNLSYTHALILLGVPEEDLSQFISDIDIESMTTRELKKAVNELKQSKQEKAGLQKALAEEKDKNTRLAQGRENLKKETSDLQKSKQELQLAESSNLKSYQRVSNELVAAQIKLLTAKIAFCYESLEKVFKELTYEMGLLAKVDSRVHGENKKKLNEFLIKAMEKRMG